MSPHNLLGLTFPNKPNLFQDLVNETFAPLNFSVEILFNHYIHEIIKLPQIGLVLRDFTASRDRPSLWF